jgi:hypothetical protein
MDGTGWTVEIEHGGRSLRSEGSNAYPPDGAGPEPTGEWRRFCRIPEAARRRSFRPPARRLADWVAGLGFLLPPSAFASRSLLRLP